MNINKLIFFVFLLLLGAPSFADSLEQSNDNLMAAIIDENMLFDHKNIKEASLSFDQKGIYQGLHLVLKEKAAEQFVSMTELALGKEIIFVFKKKILAIADLASPLGGDLLVKGISQVDAYQFIRSLNTKAGNSLVRDYVSAGVLG